MAASPMRLLAGDALVIVALQRDFCSSGALPIAGADEIVPVINDLIKETITAHALIVASRDWHPPDQETMRKCGAVMLPRPVWCDLRFRCPAGLPRAPHFLMVPISGASFET